MGNTTDTIDRELLSFQLDRLEHVLDVIDKMCNLPDKEDFTDDSQILITKLREKYNISSKRVTHEAKY